MRGAVQEMLGRLSAANEVIAHTDQSIQDMEAKASRLMCLCPACAGLGGASAGMCTWALSSTRELQFLGRQLAVDRGTECICMQSLPLLYLFCR